MCRCERGCARDSTEGRKCSTRWSDSAEGRTCSTRWSDSAEGRMCITRWSDAAEGRTCSGHCSDVSLLYKGERSEINRRVPDEDYSTETCSREHRKSLLMAELKLLVDLMLRIVNKQLQETQNLDAKVFYLTRKGDLYRYRAMTTCGYDRKEAEARSLGAYRAASEIASNELEPSHPLRLSLALNVSVLYYETLNHAEEARRVLLRALGGSERDRKCNDYCKLFNQMLRLNLAAYTYDLLGQGRGVVRTCLDGDRSCLDRDNPKRSKVEDAVPTSIIGPYVCVIDERRIRIGDETDVKMKRYAGNDGCNKKVYADTSINKVRYNTFNLHSYSHNRSNDDDDEDDERRKKRNNSKGLPADAPDVKDEKTKEERRGKKKTKTEMLEG